VDTEIIGLSLALKGLRYRRQETTDRVFMHEAVNFYSRAVKWMTLKRSKG